MGFQGKHWGKIIFFNTSFNTPILFLWHFLPLEAICLFPCLHKGRPHLTLLPRLPPSPLEDPQGCQAYGSLCCFLFHFHLRDAVCLLSKPIFIQRPKMLPLCFDLKRNMYLPEAIWCSKTPIKIHLFISPLWRLEKYDTFFPHSVFNP